jgi:hypothetical protein
MIRRVLAAVRRRRHDRKVTRENARRHILEDW